MFKKSSCCRWDDPACAEVDGLDTERVIIRSTVTLHGVAFTRGEWAAFIKGAKAGEFDLLPLPETATARQ